MAKSRQPVLGVVDQIVSSATNFLTAFLASYTLAPDAFSTFVIGYAIVIVISAVGRSLVGEPLLAHLPTVAAGARSRMFCSAMACAVVIGGAASILLLGLGLSGARPLTSLIWFAPWLPVVFVQDACRFVFLALEDTGRALTIDVAWALAQGVALAVTIAFGDLSIATLSAGWGIGALAGIAGFLVLTPGTIVPSDPRPWMRETRYLSGWFTLTSLLGQCQIYTVVVLAGLVLLPIDTAGLRAVQLMVFQPSITIIAAFLVVVTPLVARLEAQGRFREIRTVRWVTLGGSAVLSAVILLAVPLRGFLLKTFFPLYTAFDHLVLPLALQSVASAFSVPFVALLRGFRQARLLFLIEILCSPLLVVAALAGMLVAGVVGLAWGLAAASAVTLIVLSSAAPRLRSREDGECKTVQLPSGAIW